MSHGWIFISIETLFLGLCTWGWFVLFGTRKRKSQQFTQGVEVDAIVNSRTTPTGLLHFWSNCSWVNFRRDRPWMICCPNSRVILGGGSTNHLRPVVSCWQMHWRAWVWEGRVPVDLEFWEGPSATPQVPNLRIYSKLVLGLCNVDDGTESHL